MQAEGAEAVALGVVETAEAEKPEGSVGEEVAGLADEVVEGVPVLVDDVAEERLEQVVQGLGGVVGAETGLGFSGEDEHKEGNGKPDADPGMETCGPARRSLFADWPCVGFRKKVWGGGHGLGGS